MSNAAASKQALRTKLLQLRRAQPAEHAAQSAIFAQKHLINSPCWQNARVIAAYVGIRDELATDLILDTAWAQGKTVLLPRCQPPKNTATTPSGLMDFVACTSKKDLQPARFGLLEPKQDMPIAQLLPDVLIVPAVAYDIQGNRLGYGGGYYDRFLAYMAKTQAQYTVGLAFSFQILDNIPTESWDYPVQALCTERGFVWL